MLNNTKVLFIGFSIISMGL